MIIMLDAGHGIETLGKRSPDGVLREYKYCRELLTLIKNGLETLGYKVIPLVTGDRDIPLNQRCKLANAYCKEDKNCLLVSIHNDAAGDGSKWMNATGWSVRVSPNASSKSKLLANCLAGEAKNHNIKVRKPSPNTDYWVLNLAICRDTNCPAVLTENLFQDNKDDVKFLLSKEGLQILADLHIQGIVKYILSISK